MARKETRVKQELCPACGIAFAKKNPNCEICQKQRQLLKHKRNSVLLPLLLALIASILVAGAQITYRTMILNSYQPALCRTLDEQIVTRASNNNAYIDVDISYDLTTGNGQHITGKSSLGASDVDNAERIKSFYQPGNTYACWYSPIISPVQTCILRDSVPPYLFPAMLFLLNFLLFFALFCFLYLSIYQPSRLLKNGVRTQGTVLELPKALKARTSLVRFQTDTDPPVEYKALIPGRYKANRHLSLIYDPRHPELSVRVANKSQKTVGDIDPLLARFYVCVFGCVLIILALPGFFAMG